MKIIMLVMFLFASVQGNQPNPKEQPNCRDVLKKNNDTLVWGKSCCVSKNGSIQIYDEVNYSHIKCCSYAENPLYDSGTKLCNGTTVIEKTNDLDECQGFGVYNKTLFECRFKSENSFETELVAKPPIQPIALQTVKTMSDHGCPPDQKGCCRGIRLDLNQLCSQRGKIIEKEHIEDDEVCNEDRTFNSLTHVCLDDIVTEKRQGYGICGNIVWYNLKQDLCCLGVKYPHAQSNNLKCCGTEISGQNQFCCFDKVYEKKTDFKCFENKYQHKSEIVDTSKPLHLYYFRDAKLRRSTGSEVKTCKYTVTLVYFVDSNLEEPALKKRVTLNIVQKKKCRKFQKKRWYTILSGKALSGKILKLEKKNQVTRVAKGASIYLEKHLKRLGFLG